MTTAAELLQMKERLSMYLAAEVAILQGAQSYTIKDRTIDRANLSWLQKQIKELQQQIAMIENGGIKTVLGVPRDL